MSMNQKASVGQAKSLAGAALLVLTTVGCGALWDPYTDSRQLPPGPCEGAGCVVEVSRFTPVSSGTRAPLHAIWGSAANDVWIVGGAGTTLHWNGAQWNAEPSGTHETLHGVWGTGPRDVWAVGTAGAIVHWDGQSWSQLSSTTTADLHDVWGSDANSVWVVGDAGTILQWRGPLGFTSISSGAGHPLRGIWGTGPRSFWVVGYVGTILAWDGSHWDAVPSATQQHLHAITGSGPTDIIAVGGSDAATIVDTEGAKWSHLMLADKPPLSDVWGAANKGLWAVGANGTILRQEGQVWTALPSGTTQDLFAVWGSDANNIWIAGAAGVLLKYQP